MMHITMLADRAVGRRRPSNASWGAEEEDEARVNLAPPGSSEDGTPTSCGSSSASSPQQSGLANALASGVANLARNMSFPKQLSQPQLLLQRHERPSTVAAEDDDVKQSSEFDLRRSGGGSGSYSCSASKGGATGEGDLIEGFPERRVPSSSFLGARDQRQQQQQQPPDVGPMRRSKSLAPAPPGPVSAGGGGGENRFGFQRGSMRGDVSSSGMQREQQPSQSSAARRNADVSSHQQPDTNGSDRNHGNAEWGDLSSLGAARPGKGMGGAGLVPTQFVQSFPPQEQSQGPPCATNAQQQFVLQQQLQAQQQTLLLQQELIRKQQRELRKQVPQAPVMAQAQAQQEDAGEASKRRVEALQRATDEAFTSAQSLLNLHQEAMSAQARAIREKKKRSQQQNLELRMPPQQAQPGMQQQAALRTMRETLQSNGGEIADLLNKIKTMDVEVDTSRRVYNSFERPAEMGDDASSSANNGDVATTTSFSAMHRSASMSVGMRRTASMHPGGGAQRGSSGEASYSNLRGLGAPSSGGRQRHQSEALLCRSRSSSGAVRSILLEARYSNSSMASMLNKANGGSTNELLSSSGGSRARKKASVKFTAPTIHHISMRPLHEESGAPSAVEALDDHHRRKKSDDDAVSSGGGSSPRSADSKEQKIVEKKIEQTTGSVSEREGTGQAEEEPAPPSESTEKAKSTNESRGAAAEDDTDTEPRQSPGAPATDRKGDRDTDQGNDATLTSSVSTIDNPKAKDAAKPAVAPPMTMKDFLGQMNDRTALVQQVRSSENDGGDSAGNLVRTQSYSGGGMLRRGGKGNGDSSRGTGGQRSARDDSAAQRLADAMGLKRPDGREQQDSGKGQAVDYPLAMTRSRTFCA